MWNTVLLSHGQCLASTGNVLRGRQMPGRRHPYYLETLRMNKYNVRIILVLDLPQTLNVASIVCGSAHSLSLRWKIVVCALEESFDIGGDPSLL
jgi:hypothetical protein